MTQDFSDHIGKTRTVDDLLNASRITLLRNTLGGLTNPPLAAFSGEAADGAWPHGWQWIFFNEGPPLSELGRDGHEKLGAFIPDLPQKRRMWAGGKLDFVADPVAGLQASRQTTIADIVFKQGRSGPLWFVTLLHTYKQSGEILLKERQDLVYREEAKQGARQNPPQPVPSPAIQTHKRITVTPNPVLLFRYSALTFNGHRIHYDADYARDVEGYRGIVFHAPITATLLMNLAAQSFLHAPGKRMKSFSFRATAPIDTLAPFNLCVEESRDLKTVLWAETADGTQAMKAEALHASDPR